MASSWKYEIIIYWSDEDEAYVAEAPERPSSRAARPTERPTHRPSPMRRS